MIDFQHHPIYSLVVIAVIACILWAAWEALMFYVNRAAERENARWRAEAERLRDIIRTGENPEDASRALRNAHAHHMAASSGHPAGRNFR